MHLATEYLGLKLKNPLVVGSWPFCDNLDAASRLEDAGAGALVMRSLFAEQIEGEQRALSFQFETPEEGMADATAHYPGFADFQLGPDEYLRQLEHLKGTVRLPVIASLNG